MTKTLNDRGRWVVAVGAPGSVERAKCEWPVLIDELKCARDLSTALDTARHALSLRRIPSQSIEYGSILEAAGWDHHRILALLNEVSK